MLEKDSTYMIYRKLPEDDVLLTECLHHKVENNQDLTAWFKATDHTKTTIYSFTGIMLTSFATSEINLSILLGYEVLLIEYPKTYKTAEDAIVYPITQLLPMEDLIEPAPKSKLPDPSLN